jgi:protein-disulfide isomerase
MNKLNKKTAAIIILIVIIIIGALILRLHSAVTPKITTTAQKFSVPDRNNYFLGTTTPKVTIFEFSDFACPYCQQTYPTIRELSYKYPNSIKIIFKDFPIHGNSLDLAMAARCAGEQKPDYFWAMHDKLFAWQGQFATTSLPDIAASIGADRAKFNACLVSKKYLSDIRNDYTDGQALEIAGTPTFFINGYKVAGVIPEDRFEKMIEQFLK